MDRVPIQNIYYLLCYAWNHLQETHYADVRTEECSKIWDLLAKVLVRSSQQLVKRGVHRNYVERYERRVRPRGKLLFTDGIRRPVVGSAAIPCQFDELDADVLPNQIIRATLRLLQRHSGLSEKIAREVNDVAPYWMDYSAIAVSPRTFRRLQLNRSMRHYRFALSICELIHREYLPAEESGERQFRDFLRDEASMGTLFENFVFNFLEKEQGEYRVSAPEVRWAVDPENSSDGGLRLLPKMRTDIVLASDRDRIIVDCKFYKDAFQRHHDTAKFISGNLYQLFTYLKNQETVNGWEHARGMLLYPTTGQGVDETVRIHGHDIRVASINLDQDWQSVAADMLGLLSEPRGRSG